MLYVFIPVLKYHAEAIIRLLQYRVGLFWPVGILENYCDTIVPSHPERRVCT